MQEMLKIFNEALGAISRGDHAEALKMLRWPKSGSEESAGRRNVRRGVHLMAWQGLAARYPPALDALRETLDWRREEAEINSDPEIERDIVLLEEAITHAERYKIDSSTS